MYVKPFKVEEWINAHERTAKYNISSTGVVNLTLDGLLELTGTDREAFLEELCSRRLSYGHGTTAGHLRPVPHAEASGRGAHARRRGCEPPRFLHAHRTRRPRGQHRADLSAALLDPRRLWRRRKVAQAPQGRQLPARSRRTGTSGRSGNEDDLHHQPQQSLRLCHLQRGAAPRRGHRPRRGGLAALRRILPASDAERRVDRLGGRPLRERHLHQQHLESVLHAGVAHGLDRLPRPRFRRLLPVAPRLQPRQLRQPRRHYRRAGAETRRHADRARTERDPQQSAGRRGLGAKRAAHLLGEAAGRLDHTALLRF